jgi:hypothetical protein
VPKERDLAAEAAENETGALLQDMVLDSLDVHQFLDGLVTVVSTAFSGASGEDFCGVTSSRRSSMTTVASSNQHARVMDEVQYGLDDGPCLRSAREGYTAHIPDVLTETLLASLGQTGPITTHVDD